MRFRPVPGAPRSHPAAPRPSDPGYYRGAREPPHRGLRGAALFALLVLVFVVALVWAFGSAGGRFLSGFASLLSEPVIERGPLAFFTGRSYLTGRFRDRQVAVRLQLKRGKYSQGYLVIAVRTTGPHTLDNDAVEARTRDDAGRRALSAIAVSDLVMDVEEGWLRALWKPHGFMVFPGRFVEEKWRRVLEAMDAVAASLDSA